MRTFEIILILVNFLSLFMSFKKQSKVMSLGVAAVNLSVFLIHGIFEGFRYQMIFSYIFVILFFVYTLVKTNDRFFEARTPKTLKIIAISISIISLAVTSVLAYVLPVFELPMPTGSYDVGIKYFHLIDENRTEPFLNNPAQKRELMVKVYYPAENDNSKPFDRYFHNSSELIRLFTAGYGMPDFIFSHLKLVKTNSKEELQISNKEQSYPVILFSHGAGTTMEVQTSQCEDLASNGYIVAAIDHTYVSAATVFPDKVVSDKEATTFFNTNETEEIITQIMADDSKFVIESLNEMNEGKIDSIFKGKINLNEIGAMGHSLGGAVAYNLAINESRVKAAINLDGRVYDIPKENSTQMAPFLMLANDKYHIQSIQNRESLLKKFEELPEEEQQIMISEFMYGSKEAYNEAYNKATQIAIELTDILKKSGNLFTIEGSDHMKFTDIGFFIGSSQLRELIDIGGKTEPVRCLEITKSVTLAFFNQHLKGESLESLESLVEKYPELKKVDIK